MGSDLTYDTGISNATCPWRPTQTGSEINTTGPLATRMDEVGIPTMRFPKARLMPSAPCGVKIKWT